MAKITSDLKIAHKRYEILQKDFSKKDKELGLLENKLSDFDRQVRTKNNKLNMGNYENEKLRKNKNYSSNLVEVETRKKDAEILK